MKTFLLLQSNMDRETINYVIRYFRELLTEDEASALNHHMYTLKSAENTSLRNKMIELGWINSDPEITRLLELGYEVFEQNVVTRIMIEVPQKFSSTIVPNAINLPALHMQSNAGIAVIAGII